MHNSWKTQGEGQDRISRWEGIGPAARQVLYANELMSARK